MAVPVNGDQLKENKSGWERKRELTQELCLGQISVAQGAGTFLEASLLEAIKSLAWTVRSRGSVALGNLSDFINQCDMFVSWYSSLGRMAEDTPATFLAELLHEKSSSEYQLPKLLRNPTAWGSLLSQASLCSVWSRTWLCACVAFSRET